MNREERKKQIIERIMSAKDRDFTIKKVELSDEHKDYLRKNVKFTIKFK